MKKLNIAFLALSLFVIGCARRSENDNTKTEKEKAFKTFQKVKNISIDTFNKWDIEQRSEGGLIMRFYFDSCLYKTYIIKEDGNDNYLIKSINDKDSTFEKITNVSNLNKEKYIFASNVFISRYKLFRELHIEAINWNCSNNRLFFKEDNHIIFYDFNVTENDSGKNKIEGNWYY